MKIEDILTITGKSSKKEISRAFMTMLAKKRNHNKQNDDNTLNLEPDPFGGISGYSAVGSDGDVNPF